MKQILVALGLCIGIAAATPHALLANENNPKHAFRTGKRHYRKCDYIKATPFLKAALNLDPTNARYAYMVGKSVYMGDQPAESLPYFVSAYNLDMTIADDINYFLARAMHLNGHYEEAITYYQADMQRYEADDEAYAESQMRIAQCEAAPDVAPSAMDYDIANLGEFLNSPYPDYAATFSEDFSYLIFTTRRPRKVKQQAKRRHHVEDINEEVYESRYVNGAWTQTKIFEKPIPRWSHDASIKLAQGGNTLIYYLDNRNKGDIYISEFKDGVWTKRRSIGANINSKTSNEPSVFISNDGQALYWVSDREGGQGKKDIYVSYMEGNGEWGPGTNLGLAVNTPYDEDAPSLSPDGKRLYFASRGHNSMGGYDLFACDMLPDGSWGKAQNMGSTINSVGDDIYLVWRADLNGFYFSSDRPGGHGEKDIYLAVPTNPAEAPAATVVAGTVVDRNTGKPIAAELNLMDAKDRVIANVVTDANNSRYELVIPRAGTYELEVKADACAGGPMAENVEKTNVVSGTIIDALTKQPLNAEVSLYDGTTGQLIEKMATNPKTGNYMFPVASGKGYVVKVKSADYQLHEERFSVKPTGELIAHYDEISLQRSNESNKIVITWQFFDVGKSLLKGESIADLDHVVGLMERIPHMKLNIIGHTDTDGSDESNQVLSENRARAVAQYLADRGVDPSRLNTVGMGESMPLTPNTTPESKKLNRRVELFIIE